MDPQFSEFQFTYGLTRELENKYLHYGAPYIPTQSIENRFPIDVKLPPNNTRVAPLLLQYKRSKGLTQANAGEWSDFQQEYYRFKIYPPEKSDQHNKLVELANAMDSVYYAAPGFYRNAEYRTHARNSQLAQNTAFILPESCPKIFPGESHSIAYTVSPPEGRFYSEPSEVRVFGDFERVLSRLYEQESFVDVNRLYSTIREAEEILGIEQDEEFEGEIQSWMREKQRTFAREAGMSLAFVPDPDQEA